MKSNKVKVLAAFLALALVFSGWYVFGKIRYHIELPLYQISSCLRLYIREHQQFPVSQESLINKGYLKIEKSEHQTKYRVKCDLVEVITREPTEKIVPTKWMEVPLQKFDIQYGVDINELLVKRDVLYDNNSDQAIFLLSGPHPFFLSRAYRKISLSLYEEMENVAH